MMRNNSSDDGQIFVLGALLIAIILVSLAFSLNLVIYSENTAARGSAVAESNALDHYNTLENLTRRNIESQNDVMYMDRSTITTSSDSSMDMLIDSEIKRQARKSTAVDTTYTSTYGVILAQDDFSRSFTAQDGTTDWALMNSSGPIVKFKQRIDAASISSADQDSIDNNGLGGINALTVSFEGGSEEVFIYEYQDNGNIRVHVRGETPCSLSGSPSDVEINYVKETVNGTDCPQLGFVTSSDQTVSFENGASGSGVYGLIIGGDFPESGVNTSYFVDPTTSDANPYYHHVITSIAYTTQYDGPKQTASSTSEEEATLPSDTQ